MHIETFANLQLNGIRPFFLIRDLDVCFQGQKFEILISRKRSELALKCEGDVTFVDIDIAIEWVIFENCTLWSWPTFLEVKILRCLYLWNGKSQRKISSKIFLVFDILLSNRVTEKKNSLLNLDLLFEDQTFTIFRQICMSSTTAIGLSVSVYVYVCVCVCLLESFVQFTP